MGRMLKVGLTGGIATGKSTVARMFQEHGIPVVNSDLVAREVVEPGTEGHKLVVEAFGKEILNPDGSINRKRLGELVFSDPQKRKRLEEILHPLITRRMGQKLEALEKAGVPLVVVEVPLLFEKGLQRSMDFTVVVRAPEKVQIKRLMQREGLSKQQALKRIKSQMPLEDKVKMADFVIDNSGDLEATKKQVSHVIKHLMEMARAGGR